MRHLVALILFFVSLIACCSVQAAEPKFADIKAWEGKYPFEKVDGRKLWEHPAFVAEAKTILGDQASIIFFLDLAKGVNVPVMRKGDIVYTFACKAHACNTDSAHVFIDIKQDKLYMCWHEQGVAEDAWVSSGVKPKWLGQSGCDAEDDFDVYQKNIKE